MAYISRTGNKNAQLPEATKRDRFLQPHLDVLKDLKDIYTNGIPATQIKPEKNNSARKNTVAVVGIALGDEGKGRVVDNKIEELLKRPGVKRVNVIRFQGGNNAGHTVEKGNTKLALHLIPSGIFYKKARNIIDRGVIVHAEDLLTEITYVEQYVGDLTKRLLVSEDVILATDLERAEETFNQGLTNNAKGGTGRGIGPAYAHHYDKKGVKLYDLLDVAWEKTFTDRYDYYHKYFKAFGQNLAEALVPDYKQTLKNGKSTTQTVGSKTEFFKRLRAARLSLLKKNIVANLYPLHLKIYQDTSQAVLFEGAQATGLDAWVGTVPDVTASNTSIYGVREGTAFWQMQDVEERIGIFKLTYTSSVGQRKMPTHVEIPKDKKQLTPDQEWALWVREQAHEYGTTTGRPRDITHLDLAFHLYNIALSGVNMLIGTHLDTAREGEQIKIATHYEKNGKPSMYQPGLRHLKDIKPSFVEVPGWNGEECRNAKKVSDLPIHSLQFLAFLERRLGLPIVALTTGPKRESYLTL